jgi:hypothetical protein
LKDKFNNAKVFAELQKISVLAWKTNSGLGMAGVLYVPKLSQYNNENTTNHLRVATAITDKTTEILREKTKLIYKV